MGTLTIKGDIRQLEIIAKTSRVRVAKYGLKVSLTEDKKQEVEQEPPVENNDLVEEPQTTDNPENSGKEENATPPTANQVKELIEKVEKTEDLEQFKDDTRQVVKNAYKKKLRELSE
ncbi:hypothetical protein [Sunxiuqinia indica]|uniref:hypothetical protein n=1 Tax=Sunxiuqinia indica TaxID=2692584 RepID=UPI00135B3724|nr:hypothetical protein [Sunxiuqinia indica]